MTKTNIEDLKKIAEKQKVIFGSTEIIKKIKQGKIQKVFLASNIPQEVENDIQHNATIAKTEIEKVSLPNYEFGLLFKRVHPILALGVLKE